jgi:capsular polysaccharide biosynthesis protein
VPGSSLIFYYSARQKLWKNRLAIADTFWKSNQIHPMSKLRQEVFLLKRADRNYSRYLSTDDSSFLADALNDMEFVINLANRKPLVHSILISGWAASADIRIRHIEICSSMGTKRVRVNKKRHDVFSHYGLRKYLRSGFEASVVVADERETIQVKVTTKSDYSCSLNIKEADTALVVNQYIDGTHVGSIDSCKRLQISGPGSFVHLAKSAKVNLINIAEILLAMSRLEECSKAIDLVSDVPPGADRRIDRIRFVVQPFLNLVQASGYEVLDVRQLDSGGLSRAPSTTCVSEREVLIQTGSLLIDKEGRFLVADRAARPEFDFVSGQWEIALGSNTRLQEVQVMQRQAPTETLSSAVSLLGRNPENYFHSLIEYLPRYFTAMESGLVKDHVFLLNSESPPTIKFAAESFIPQSSIRYVSKDDSIQVKELLVPTFHTQTYDSTQIPWEYSGLMDWAPIEQFSRRMLELHLGPEEKYPDFFAVRAGGLRAIPNVKRLIRIAEEEGFEILDLSSLSFVEQLNRMYWSRKMIIPGGAGLAGMIFMQPGTSVLTLATAEQKELGTYRAIAEHAKVDLNYLLGVSTVAFGEAPFRMNQIHAPFVISPKEFRKAIRAM